MSVCQTSTAPDTFETNTSSSVGSTLITVSRETFAGVQTGGKRELTCYPYRSVHIASSDDNDVHGQPRDSMRYPTALLRHWTLRHSLRSVFHVDCVRPRH
jgi:hypothetical protein